MKRLFSQQTLLLFSDTLKCMVFSGVVLLLLFGLTRLVNFGAFDLYRLAFKEFSFLDTFYAERFSPNSTNKNDDIVLINVGHLNRGEIAEVMNKVQGFEPKIIGLDVIFDHQKNYADDKKLWQSLQPENVVAAFAFQNRQLIKNHPVLGVFRHKLGYANFNFDTYNSVIRNFQAKKYHEGQAYYSFGLRVAQNFIGLKKNIEWSDMEINSIPINYSGGKERYLTFDATTILNGANLPEIKDKIILIGYLGYPMGSSYDIEDKHFTPMNQEFLGKSAPDTFGIVVHANIIEMLITDKMHRLIPSWLIYVIGFVLTFIALAFFIKLNKKSLATYMFTRKLTQLCLTILFIGFALWLLSQNIYFKITSIVWYVVLSIECIWAYRVFSNFTNKKFGWKSYFLQQ